MDSKKNTQSRGKQEKKKKKQRTDGTNRKQRAKWYPTTTPAIR